MAIGFGLIWAAYTAGLYGYSLIRGYGNSLPGLVNPVHPAAWSTTVYAGTSVIPAGAQLIGPATAAGEVPGGSALAAINGG